jgi:hypothetical protein
MIDDATLLAHGYSLYGMIEGTVPGEDSLPDAPDRLVTDLWQSPRCGPTIGLWVRDDAGRRALEEALPTRLVSRNNPRHQ